MSNYSVLELHAVMNGTHKQLINVQSILFYWNKEALQLACFIHRRVASTQSMRTKVAHKLIALFNDLNSGLAVVLLLGNK